ncbi:hypothetical protein ACFLSJ_01035 [Verrucomicrobiota bacterium]
MRQPSCLEPLDWDWPGKEAWVARHAAPAPGRDRRGFPFDGRPILRFGGPRWGAALAVLDEPAGRRRRP